MELNAIELITRTMHTGLIRDNSKKYEELVADSTTEKLARTAKEYSVTTIRSSKLLQKSVGKYI